MHNISHVSSSVDDIRNKTFSIKQHGKVIARASQGTQYFINKLYRC